MNLSHARAVLNQDGSCPNPVEEACQTRKNPLQAFIEGPISCRTLIFFLNVLSSHKIVV